MPTSLVALLVLSRSLIRSRVELQLESLALRHQIVIASNIDTRVKMFAEKTIRAEPNGIFVKHSLLCSRMPAGLFLSAHEYGTPVFYPGI